jgi:antagonist of KipI
MLRVLRPGVLTTVQDLGRRGLGRTGVSTSGAMDPLALRIANRLLGNRPGAPALEVTGPGVQLLFERAAWIGLAGADLGAQAGSHALPGWQAHLVGAGEVLAFESRTCGARSYVALPGGLRVAEVMGSAATDLDARFGGLDGAALRRGDALDWNDEHEPTTRLVARRLRDVLRWYDNPFALAVVVAADAPAEAGGVLLDGAYRVGDRSSRMGYRLEGRPARVPAAAEAISEAIAPGAVQVTADGQPILLMADRQTVGGYPVVAHLARAHVPKAAQLWPGDFIRFVPMTVEEAQRLAREQEATVAAL